jgi:2-polyprenyl-6-methoxyphenol hydroxylase-like FAD-dependent oxidoreductase
VNLLAEDQRRYDVIIIGGALAGAATAILLLRQQPKLRVLIVEKSSAFTRRVGEATVEVSGYFLSRMLGLTQHLNEAHLVKQGMRFWFFNEETETLDQCSEIGGRYLPRVPAYQVTGRCSMRSVATRPRARAPVWRRPAAWAGFS